MTFFVGTFISFLKQLRTEYNWCVTEWMCGDPDSQEYGEAAAFINRYAEAVSV